MHIAKTALETIRAKKAQHEKYASRRAAHTAERDAFLTSHSGALDEKTGAKMANTLALLALADAGEPRLREELRLAVMAGVEAESHCINPAYTAHAAIDDAIAEQVRASIPEDLRKGVDHKVSRLWLTEQAARYIPKQGSVWTTPTSTFAEIYRAAEIVVLSLESSLAEINRTAAIAKRLGIAVAA